MDIHNTNFDKYTKIWSGPKELKFFDADCSIGRILFAFTRNSPTKICQIAELEGYALTHGQALTLGIRIAQHLKRFGLKHDDVVGIIGTNTTYVMPLVLGCLLNSTPFHAISPHNDEDTVKQLFCITRPKVIFCDGDIYEKVSEVIKILRAKVYTLKEHREELAKIEDLLGATETELYFVPATLKLGGDQTIAILSTSGTTGIPKAVCISNTACHFDYGFVTSHDVLLAFSTIDSSSGLFNILFSCGQGATRIITDKPYSPELLLELVVKFKVTILTLTPQQVTKLLSSPAISKDKLASVRFLSIGSGNCYVPALLKIQEYLSAGFVSYGYALTEFGVVAANMGVKKASSVGKIVAGVRLKIIDEAGRSLGPNERGEILVHNGKVWNGYYGNPSETKRMLDYQSWFHTGDIGYMDTENFLYVVDRQQEMLKFHGMQYWPYEIEQVVAEIPDVVEVCVFGLWNEVDGDAAAAAVVKKQGSKLSEQEVVEYVARRLVVEQKQLHCGVFFMDALPKTSSGKVLRGQARDLALGKKWIAQKNGLDH